MARAVAELDGDSSGLVGALDDGKKAMAKMEGEGKKLSDQLREVADEADKAAGSFVQKLGGPGAIKAIGGVGIAVGVAKAGVDAFLGSAEALFKSFGDEGMKVWDDTEKALFSIQGAFAEAVLGGGSVEQMGARLKSIFEGVKTAVDVLLTPVKLLSQALVDNSAGANQAATATKLYNEAVEKSGTTTKTTIGLVAELTQKYLALTNQTDALKLAEIGQSLAKIRMQQAEVWATEKATDEANAQMEVANQRKELERQAYIEWSKPHKMEPIYPGSSTMFDPRANETAAEIFEKLQWKALQASRAKFADLSVETRLELDRLKSLYEAFGGLYAEVGKPVKPATTPTGSTGGTGPKEDPVAAAINAASQATGNAYAKASAQMQAEWEHAQNAAMGWWGGFNPETGWVDSWRTAADAVKGIYNDVVTAILGGNQKIEESNEVVLTKEQEGMKASYDQFVNQNAKQVAISLAGGASMAEAARAALGSIITALGDRAMSEAGLAFALGNIPGAAALTAAGAAAYATGAFLGSTAKKAGSATAATKAAPSPVTNNTSYNLQIDAAFADEESIARSFAKAQALARLRHMTTDLVNGAF